MAKRGSMTKEQWARLKAHDEYIKQKMLADAIANVRSGAFDPGEKEKHKRIRKDHAAAIAAREAAAAPPPAPPPAPPVSSLTPAQRKARDEEALALVLAQMREEGEI